MGTYTNRLDAKGRVSIPAPFRSLLRDAEEAPVQLVLRKSAKFPCIEGWRTSSFDALATRLSQLQQFSDEYDDLSTDIYGDALPMEADREGRIMLPAGFVSHAGVTGTVAFKGVGELFQIWEPEAAGRRQDTAAGNVRDRKLTLPRAGA